MHLIFAVRLPRENILTTNISQITIHSGYLVLYKILTLLPCAQDFLKRILQTFSLLKSTLHAKKTCYAKDIHAAASGLSLFKVVPRSGVVGYIRINTIGNA